VIARRWEGTASAVPLAPAEWTAFSHCGTAEIATSASPLRQTFERSEKSRAGNHGRIRSMNDGLAFRS
jgi:hypothetical protein